MKYEEMVKEAYEDILDSFEKSAKKKKEEDDKEKVYDTPLGKKHVIKGALKGAAKVAPWAAAAGAGYGTAFGLAGAPVVGFGKTTQEAKRSLNRAVRRSAGKGAGVGSLVGAGVGLGLGALAGAKGASDERKLSQLSPERQRAIKKKLNESADRFNAEMNAALQQRRNYEAKDPKAAEDYEAALAEYRKVLKEGKQIIKDKKANKK